jgi:hypothetical protein
MVVTTGMLFACVMLCACGHGKPVDSVSSDKADHSGPAAEPAADAAPIRIPDSSGLAAGGTITLQLREVLDSDTPSREPFVLAKVPEDILGADGRLAFPAGSHALLVVRESGKLNAISEIILALYSISAGGRQIRFVEGVKDLARATFSENGADGPTHRNVHLAEDTRISFKLESALSLK